MAAFLFCQRVIRRQRNAHNEDVEILLSIQMHAFTCSYLWLTYSFALIDLNHDIMVYRILVRFQTIPFHLKRKHDSANPLTTDEQHNQKESAGKRSWFKNELQSIKKKNFCPRVTMMSTALTFLSIN